MEGFEGISRFDDRGVIVAIVARLRTMGADLDSLDVALSRRGPVDLDLLHDCVSESFRTTHGGEARAA